MWIHRKNREQQKRRFMVSNNVRRDQFTREKRHYIKKVPVSTFNRSPSPFRAAHEGGVWKVSPPSNFQTGWQQPIKRKSLPYVQNFEILPNSVCYNRKIRKVMMFVSGSAGKKVKKPKFDQSSKIGC